MKHLLALCGLLSATAAFAAEQPAAGNDGYTNKLYLDAGLSAGYTRSSVPTSFSSPTLISFGAGATGAWRVGSSWAFGVTTDFRLINQYSTVDSNLGNRRGTRWNIVSPTAVYFCHDWIFKGDVQFLGKYRLSESTAGGDTVSFTKPLGARITAMKPIWDKIHGGLMFEYLVFSKQSIENVSETELTNKLKMWQIGLVANYVF